MICLVNPERLLRFTKREVIQPTEVNLLSMEGSDHTIFLVIEMFKRRKGRQHLRFWIGGTYNFKGHLIRECLIYKGIVTYMDE